jgi:hypothetical protein
MNEPLALEPEYMEYRRGSFPWDFEEKVNYEGDGLKKAPETGVFLRRGPFGELEGMLFRLPETLRDNLKEGSGN